MKKYIVSLLALTACASSVQAMEEGSTSNVPSLKDQCLRYVANNNIHSLAQLEEANLPLDIKDELVKFFINNHPMFEHILQYVDITIADESEALVITKLIKHKLKGDEVALLADEKNVLTKRHFSEIKSFQDHCNKCKKFISNSGGSSTIRDKNTKTNTEERGHRCKKYDGNFLIKQKKNKSNNQQQLILKFNVNQTKLWDLGKLIELHSYLHSINFEQAALLNAIYHAMSEGKQLHLDEQQQALLNTFIPEVKKVLLPYIQNDDIEKEVIEQLEICSVM